MDAKPSSLAVSRLLILVILLPAVACAQPIVQAWVQPYRLTTHENEAWAIAVDSSNAVIVTGQSAASNGYDDYATIKYSRSGVPLWTNRYNGPGNSTDIAWSVAVDGSDNVIVNGYSRGSDTGYDYLTIKYSSAGVALWTNRYNGPGNGTDNGFGVVVDRNNDIVVTGNSQNEAGAYDSATLKYSSAGELLWLKRYSGPGGGNVFSSQLVLDSSNSVVVIGFWPNATSGNDFLTIKYSSAGVPLWTNSYNGPGNGNDFAYAVAVDGSNNVIVTGPSTNDVTGYDYATIKYSSAGVALWTNRYNGPGNTNDYAYAVAVDGSNNVIVTGYSAGSGTGDDYATIKYSSAGAPLWTNRYNGPANGNDRVYGHPLAVDAAGNVIVTGRATNSASGDDYLTIEYSSAGVPLWTNSYNGVANLNDSPHTVVVDRAGNVIVTGGSGYGAIPTPGTPEYLTIKYSPVPPPTLSVLPVSNGAFQLRVDDVLPVCTLVIQTSLNMKIWGPVFTNHTPTNLLFYTAPGVKNYPQRFYRALQFP